MANIDKINISGTSYTIVDSAAMRNKIVSAETVSAGVASFTLDATKYHTVSACDSLTLAMPASYNVPDEFIVRFVCNSSGTTNITLPQGVVLKEGLDLTEDVSANRKFVLLISDGIAYYSYVDQLTNS